MNLTIYFLSLWAAGLASLLLHRAKFYKFSRVLFAVAGFAGVVHPMFPVALCELWVSVSGGLGCATGAGSVVIGEQECSLGLGWLCK